MVLGHGSRGPQLNQPAGQLLVAGAGVYLGTDPITGRQRVLSHTVPAGPTALAEAACRPLLTRSASTDTHPPASPWPSCWDRHLALLHASDTTRRSYRYTVAKHLRLAAVTPQLLDHAYAELRRCRDHCRRPQDGHRCRPLHPSTIRKIHYLLSGAYRRAVRWAGSTAAPPRDADPHPNR